MSKEFVNTNADDVVTVNGCIWNDDTRTVANAVNYNAQILKDVLNRIAKLEKDILKAESDADFPQAKDIEPTVESFSKVLDNKLIKEAIDE